MPWDYLCSLDYENAIPNFHVGQLFLQCFGSLEEFFKAKRRKLLRSILK